ncbi:AfsR/SARP family transcriptional regulator [Paractinoplanes abujensis]|uniref:DNA-binding SARP family transcriptional activator n=1 Tax=Paractinoplanes abujensis TaxID=882441 RepID=A0A7W7G534_9ACTN|nr:BTAD domain-containing putative transcriptional regulator [Actinoplanes abujensis]MBB4694511.1 DNA-binding SARP family transcriptional activator [Actinoplanes abujensis]
MSSSELAEIRILAFGEIAVTVDGVAVAAGPPKQRALLALLLCRPGAEVPSGELIEALWSSQAPSSARNNLRTYVHGLRRILGEDRVSGNGRPGYRLHRDDLWTDVGHFEALCAAADRALADAEPDTARAALAEAVALRRGPAFGDVGPPAVVEDEAARLEERWLLAVEQRIELDLRRGSPAQVIGELSGLVKRHPWRERFAALLMLALYRSGRQTDALTTYRQTAAALADELGIEPGAELTELHQAMLRQDPALDRQSAVPAGADSPVVARPAELPPGSGHFTGRTREGTTLDAALADARISGRLPVLAVVGPAGIGKTSLVVEWAQRAVADFPDGQIFADLRGFSAEPVTPPADALRRLLWSLGVEADRVPAAIEEAAALLRSLLSGKRLLMILDNAASAEQVVPLLPGGTGNAVVVTSRNRLAGLIARHGARQLVLEPLAEDEALSLVARIAGPVRVRMEAAAARALVRRCSRLPLALCIAAADVAEDPAQTITEYLVEHRAEARARGNPELAVLAAFDLSLRGLSAGQQRLLLLLGVVPGPTFTADAAAALAGSTAEAVEPDLFRLVNAHFVQRRGGGRFAFHDLIREYTRTKAPAPERAAALHRLLEHYREFADAADRILQPGALRLPSVAGRDPFAGDVAAARSWFADESADLVAACRATGEPGHLATVAQLADTVGRYLWTRVDLDNWTVVAEAGARAARLGKDLRGQVAAQIALARIADCRCDFTTGVARYAEAAALARRAHWPEAEQLALGSTAALHGQLGDLRSAVRQLEASLTATRELGDRLHEGRTLQLLGAYRAEQGELRLAGDLFRQALAVIEKQGSRIGQAIILTNTAELSLLRGEFGEAARQAGRALSIADEVGHVSCRIGALVNLSAAWRGLGVAATALPYVQQALAIPAGLDARDLGVVLHEAAEVHDALGEPGRAIEYHRTAYRLTASAQARSPALTHAIALALAEHRWVRSGRAGTTAPDTPDPAVALAEARRYGYRGLEGFALAALAEISRDRGRPAEAARLAEQALRRQRESGRHTDPELLTAIIEAAGPQPVSDDTSGLGVGLSWGAQ